MQDMQQPLLFSYKLGDIQLKNRIVMASLTRARATNKELIPTKLMSEYYAQRVSAGLIITEATWVSPKSIGFINVPGIFTQQQIQGWKDVTDAVHSKRGKIFLQLGHSGTMSHPDYFNGELPGGPSAVNPQTKSFTPEGFKDTVTPREFTIAEIKDTIKDYKQAGLNAKKAGFDGIEIHAQAGMFIAQFLSINTNKRTDEYGGNIENRSRIIFEILDALKEVWDSSRIAIKFTPAALSSVGIIVPDEYTIETFKYITQKLNDYNLAYLHIAGPAESLDGTPVEAFQEHYFRHFRQIYKGTLMANLGFTKDSGNTIIKDGIADLVSYGTYYIANPDLVERFKYNIPLAESNRDFYYTGGEKGYMDYAKADYSTGNL